MNREEIVSYVNKLLNIKEFSDYGPNGLQIEGIKDVNKIAFAVSATKYSIEKAVEFGADMLIVHHGLFWKFHGVRTITDSFANRVKPLIQNDINLLGYHLPLDAHIEYGNAAALATRLEMSIEDSFGDYKGSPTGVQGKLKTPLTPTELGAKLEKVLEHKVIISTYDEEAKISSIGIITGGANGDWTRAKRAGLDAYITGEISEHDWHEAKESDMHFFAGGHNATEQFGIQDLMKHLYDKFEKKNVEFFYIPSNNPA